MGLTHIAMTDHGSMAAMIEFHEACKKASITGIIGMEAYIVDDRLDHTAEKLHTEHHLVLLAKNKEGVKNLLKIHNDAHINGFYGKPKTDMSMLKKYGKNLIGLSACVSGEIPQLILQGDMKGAEDKLNEYKSCLDEFYLEIQPGHFADQEKVNKGILYLAYKTRTPFVATNDIHYLNKEDCLMHDIHVKDRRKNVSEEMVYADTCYYLMGEGELSESFVRSEYMTDKIVAAAIENTNRIAELCDGEVDYNFEMPRYLDLPKGETEKSYLTKLCYESLQQHMVEIANPAKYSERLDYELDTIESLGFCGYFLIVRDFLEYARTHDVSVGPGRGSVGGSLVAWLLGITVADPIKYNLVFERFLSAKRVGLPDVDVDFSDAGKMKDYVIQKYGAEHCALVGTFGIRKAKGAIRAAGRLLNMDLDIVDEICKAAPFRVAGDDGEQIQSPTIMDMLKVSTNLQEKRSVFPELFEKAIQLESFPQSVGIHAAGIVISPHSLLEYMPIRVDKETGRYVSYITKENIESVALKFDFLSLATQKVVDDTVRDAGIKINLNDDSFFTDETVWDAIGTNHTTGMFQISSSLYKTRMPRLAPRNLQQLAACLALVRGPCISAGTDETYMQIVEGKETIQKLDPRYDAITAETNGVCIYQEQVMQIGTAFGLDLDGSYKLLKAISKKHLDKVRPMREVIWNRANDMGIAPEVVTQIWKIIENAAKYSFNQAHAVSYAIISYLSAWLKVHYPAHFMANLLTNAYVNNKDVKAKAEIVADCQRLGVQFLPVDVNKSDWRFRVEDDKIRIGLCAIKAFGEKAAEELIAARPIENFNSFIEAGSVKGSQIGNKTRGTVLILAGAFNSLGADKEELLLTLLESKKKTKKEEVTLPEEFNICKGCTIRLDAPAADTEKQLFGAVMVNAPAASLAPIHFASLNIGASFKGSVYIDEVKEITDRRGQQMAFVDLTANDGTFSGVIFGSVYPKIKTNIKKCAIITVDAKKDKDGSCVIFDVA